MTTVDDVDGGLMVGSILRAERDALFKARVRHASCNPKGDDMQSERTPKLDRTSHIDMADHASVESWASKLGTSAEHLRDLIARVGPRVQDLEAELNRPDSLD